MTPRGAAASDDPRLRTFHNARATVLARQQVSGRDRRQALAAAADELLVNLVAGSGFGGGLALVAVGGLGRGELSPQSDLDLLLLHSTETPHPYAEAVAEKLWYPLWDNGIRLDHAVRSVGEARQTARQDLRTMLGLLDLRHVSGDPDLADQLRRRVLADWRADARIRLPELRASAVERWRRSGDLAFASAPDLKESRGGLRDLLVMRAVAASWIADCPHRGLDQARHTLLDIRDALHLVTGRPGDHLHPQEADEVAAALGMTGRDDLARRIGGIGRTTGHLVDVTWRRVDRELAVPAPGASRPRPTRRPLADGIVEFEGEAMLAKAADPATDPTLVTRAAAAAAQAGIPLADATAERLARRCPAMPDPWPPTALADLVRLLGSGEALLEVWETLDQVGLITQLLPGWERLRSLPQWDPMHQYSVDRHLMGAAVEASRLVRSVDRPDLLLLAAVLHDLGKGTGVDHSLAGAELAQPLLARLGLPAGDAAVVITLIRHHLLLGTSAARRDPDDPATVAAVAAAVGDRQTLDLLAALTEADARATGPAAWTAWKATQVDQLVDRVRAALDSDQAKVLRRNEFEGPRLTALIPVEGSIGFAVQVRPIESWLEIDVQAPDRRGLMATVAAAMTIQGLAVQRASLETVDRENEPVKLAVQHWVVTPEFGEAPNAAAIRAEILRALADPISTANRAARRIPGALPNTGRASTRSAPAQVRLVEGASDRATVVEVRAHDAPGLLHRLVTPLADLDISVTTALVHTWGAEVVDVLYLQTAAGSLLPPLLAGRALAAVREVVGTA